LAVGSIETGPTGREGVDGRRVDLITTRATEMISSMVVGDDQDDVRSSLFPRAMVIRGSGLNRSDLTGQKDDEGKTDDRSELVWHGFRIVPREAMSSRTSTRPRRNGILAR
jgi:hypothetical protein